MYNQGHTTSGEAIQYPKNIHALYLHVWLRSWGQTQWDQKYQVTWLKMWSHLQSLKPIRVISHIKILLKDRWILVYGSGRLIIQKYNCNKAFDPTLVVELSILDANSFKYFHRMFDEPWETRAQYVKGWNYYTKHKTFRVVKFII